MSSNQQYEFYFIINKKKVGPVMSVPYVKPDLVKEYDFLKFTKQILNGDNTLDAKFKFRAAVHKKIMDKLFRGKKASNNPTIKYLLTSERNIDLFKFLDTDSSVVFNFDYLWKQLHEKYISLIDEARKDKNNTIPLVYLKEIASEEDSYLFLKIFLKACKLKLDIILPGMLYMEPFEMVMFLFKKFNYSNLEIHLLQLGKKETEELINQNVDMNMFEYVFISHKSLFDIISNRQDVIISKNTTTKESELSEYIKKKGNVKMEIMNVDKQSVGGGRGSKKRTSRKSVALFKL